MTFKKDHFSGSVDGKSVKIASIIVTAPTLIHTAVAGATDPFDEVWLYAYNSSTTPCEITICWGGRVDPDDLIRFIVAPREGGKCIIPGWVIQNGKVVEAFAQVANVLTVFGYINNMV